MTLAGLPYLGSHGRPDSRDQRQTRPGAVLHGLRRL